MSLLHAVFIFFRALMVGRATLATENLALRQQLSILQRTAQRPKLRARDRVFWVWMGRLWSEWRSWLVLVTAVKATYYSINRTRGSPALLRFFQEHFDGVLVTDFGRRTMPSSVPIAKRA